MFYQPELFAYLMFVPVGCLVVLPALFAVTRETIGMFKSQEEKEFEPAYEEALAEA